MTLAECQEQIGGLVAYTPFGLSAVSRTQTGHIMRVNDYFAFVQWRGQIHAKGVDPHLLTLLKEAQPT